MVRACSGVDMSSTDGSSLLLLPMFLSKFINPLLFLFLLLHLTNFFFLRMKITAGAAALCSPWQHGWRHRLGNAEQEELEMAADAALEPSTYSNPHQLSTPHRRAPAQESSGGMDPRGSPL